MQEDGSIKTYDPKEYNLDNVNQGQETCSILYDIWGQAPQGASRDHPHSWPPSPGTKEGNFWHKDLPVAGRGWTAPHMAQPSTWEYENADQEMQAALTAINSSMNIKSTYGTKRLVCTTTATMSRQMHRADLVTGRSPNFWLRAMGWFMVAMVDVLSGWTSSCTTSTGGDHGNAQADHEDVRTNSRTRRLACSGR